jgi:hypothetical protein
MTLRLVFFQVECPKYPGFCIARQRKDYPFVEIFHSPKPVCTHFPFAFGILNLYGSVECQV